MNWLFEAYSNIYDATAKLRLAVPADDVIAPKARARRSDWQGFIAKER